VSIFFRWIVMPPQSYADDALPLPELGSKARLFRGPAYRDSWAAALFLIHLILVIVAAAYVVSSGRAFDEATWFPWAKDQTVYGARSNAAPDEVCLRWERTQTVALMVTASVTVTVGALMAAGWITLAAKRPLGFLRVLLLGYTATIVGSFVAQVATFGFSPQSLLILLLLPLYWWWWRTLWVRAPFSATILQKACRTVTEHRMAIAVAFLMTAVSVGYKVVWVLMLNLTVHQWHLYPLLFFLLWSELVFGNIAHTTACGVAATDFFVPEGVPHPVWGAFRRSTTFSLGSICLGSAVVAVLRFLRLLARRAKEYASDRNIAALLLLSCCVEFVYGCLESLVQYFNHYAFVHVAMYGKSFTQAARDAWALVKTSGVDAILNDMIIHTAVGMCNVLSSLAAAVACGGAAYGLSHGWWAHCTDSRDTITAFTALVAVSGALTVLFLQSVVFGVLDSAVVTFFVCFAEEPEVLALKHPDLDMEITRRINQLRNG